MGNRFGNFPNREAAIAQLEADGFERKFDAYGERWLKRGKVDDWYGGYEKVAMVKVVFCPVAPEYGGGGYYQHQFI